MSFQPRDKSKDSSTKGFQCIFPGTHHALNLAASSTVTAAFATETTVIRVFATKDCWLQIGAAPTAVADTSTCFMHQGGFAEYYGVSGAQKLAAIMDTSTGEVFILEGQG